MNFLGPGQEEPRVVYKSKRELQFAFDSVIVQRVALVTKGNTAILVNTGRNIFLSCNESSCGLVCCKPSEVPGVQVQCRRW